MKVKIPREIKIGAIKATVKITRYLRSDNAWNACFNKRTCEIEVDSQLTGDIRDGAFTHEVTHLIDIDKECGLSEENISRIGNGWLEFLRDNLGIQFDWQDISNE